MNERTEQAMRKAFPTDEEITAAFANTNFGSTDYKAIVLEGLRKTALGYHNGWTLTQILREKLHLADEDPNQEATNRLNKRGLAYLMQATQASIATPQPQTVQISDIELLKYAADEELFLFADQEDFLAIANGVLELVRLKLKQSITPQQNKVAGTLRINEHHEYHFDPVDGIWNRLPTGTYQLALIEPLSAATGWQGENAMLTKEKPNELISALKQAYLVIYKLYEHYDSSEKSYGFAETLATIDKALANYATHSGVAVQEPVAKVIFTNRSKPDVEWLVDKVTKGTLLYAAPTLDKE